MAEATQTPPVPPVVGTICWSECYTKNPAATRDFYTKLFGWQTEEVPMGDCGTYTMFKNDETMFGAIMELKGEQFENFTEQWLNYIAVDDVDAMAKNAEQLGAKICCPPTDIPNIGRFSILTDPTGATIALFKGA